MDCFETPGKTLQLHYALATVLQPYKSESVAHQIIHESKCYHGIGENKEVCTECQCFTLWMLLDAFGPSCHFIEWAINNMSFSNGEHHKNNLHKTLLFVAQMAC